MIYWTASMRRWERRESATGPLRIEGAGGNLRVADWLR